MGTPHLDHCVDTFTCDGLREMLTEPVLPNWREPFLLNRKKKNTKKRPFQESMASYC